MVLRVSTGGVLHVVVVGLGFGVVETTLLLPPR